MQIQLASLIKNATIVKVGVYVDSGGTEVEFTKENLRELADNFTKIPIPLKLGHTSDKFNASIAKALDVPVDILKGEGSNNHGAAKLGEVIALSANGTLIADIKLANDRVGKLVEDGYFDGFSIEMSMDFEFNKENIGATITGLSMLGSENPAIYDLPKLQADMLLASGSKYDHLIFERFNMPKSKLAEHNPEEDAKRKKDEEDKKFADEKDEEDKKAKLAENNNDDDDDDKDKEKEKAEMQLTADLGKVLKLSTPTRETILESIAELVNNKADDIKSFAQYTAKLETLTRKIKFNEYKEHTLKLTSMPGKPDDLANNLVMLEEKGGTEAATLLLESYQAQQKQADELKLTKRALDSNKLNEDTDSNTYEFETHVAEYAKANELDKMVAFSEYASKNTREFTLYRKLKDDNLN